MSIVESEPRRLAPQTPLDDTDTALRWPPIKNTYECRALVCEEEEGGYSAYALCLPGVVSQGETEEEAKRNIAEAFGAALSVYLEHGDPIPWAPVEIEWAKGGRQYWVLAHV